MLNLYLISMGSHFTQFPLYFSLMMPVESSIVLNKIPVPLLIKYHTQTTLNESIRILEGVVNMTDKRTGKKKKKIRTVEVETETPTPSQPTSVNVPKKKKK